MGDVAIGFRLVFDLLLGDGFVAVFGDGGDPVIDGKEAGSGGADGDETRAGEEKRAKTGAVFGGGAGDGGVEGGDELIEGGSGRAGGGLRRDRLSRGGGWGWSLGVGGEPMSQHQGHGAPDDREEGEEAAHGGKCIEDGWELGAGSRERSAEVFGEFVEGHAVEILDAAGGFVTVTDIKGDGAGEGRGGIEGDAPAAAGAEEGFGCLEEKLCHAATLPGGEYGHAAKMALVFMVREGDGSDDGAVGGGGDEDGHGGEAEGEGLRGQHGVSKGGGGVGGAERLEGFAEAGEDGGRVVGSGGPDGAGCGHGS